MNQPRFISKDELRTIIKNGEENKGMTSKQVLKYLTQEKGYVVEGFDAVKKQRVAQKYRKQQREKSSRAMNIFRDVVGAAGDAATSVASFAGSALGDGVGYVAKQFGDDAFDQKVDIAVDSRKSHLQDGKISRSTLSDTNSNTYKGVKTAADMATVVAPGGIVNGAAKTAKATSILGKAKSLGANAINGVKGVLRKVGLGTKATEKTTKIGSKIVRGGTEGLSDVAMYDLQANQEIATGEELASGAVLGGALPVIAVGLKNLGGKAYKAAFKQAKSSLDEQSISQFRKGAGDLVYDEGIDGLSLSQIKESIGSSMRKTWKTLGNKVEEVGDIDISTIGKSLKRDITDKMTNGINKNTEYYTSLIDNINDIVDFYVGKEGSTNGREMVELITDLNSSLPSSIAKNSELVLDPQKSKTLIKSMKRSIQSFLDDEVDGVIDLYKDYGRKKLIKDIVSNVEVKKMLGRQIMGGLFGGAMTSTDEFMNGNFGEGMKSLVIGALVGSLITKQATNPNTLIKIGKILEVSDRLLIGSTPITTNTFTSNE